MPINLSDASKGAVQRLAAAFASDSQGEVAEALEQTFADYHAQIASDLADQFRAAVASNDAAVLAQRGFRSLTGEEARWYQRAIDALSGPDPKQAFSTIAASDDAAIPTTVIDQVLEDITVEHPLLAAIRLTNTKTLTRWIVSEQDQQMAAWGELESEVVKEIVGAYKVKEIGQNKLSCFACLSIDMLKLGPTFMDAYLRTSLGEAMACALEAAIIDGKGVKGEPVGLMREVGDDVEVNQTTGYPAKAAVAVTDFEPASYGALVAGLAKDDKGRDKKTIASLTLVCNTTDYLTKVMPATTVRRPEGTYANDIFPVPTRVLQSDVVPEGKAVLALLDEYQMFVGGNRGIEYSDEYKFLEDQRVFKTVMYANGVAKYKTTATVLDISGLEPAFYTVKVAQGGAAKMSAKKS